MAKKKEVVNPALSEVRKFLKAHKKGSMDHIVEFQSSDMDDAKPHVPIGNLKIEHLIGGPYNEFGVNRCSGFPRSAMSQVYGKEHCGKTSLCLHAAAQACSAGGNVLYVDYEHILDVRYARYLGVPVDDPERFMLYQPPTLEEGVGAAIAAIHAGVDLVVFDSIGAAIPLAQNTDVDDITKGKNGALGLTARAWSTLLPVLQSKLSEFGNTALVGISQTRAAMNAYSDSVQGGNAWKFYAAVRLGMKPIGSAKTKMYDNITNTLKEVKTSTSVRIRVDKNKVAGTSHWEVVVDVMPFRGFDPLTAVYDILTSHKVVKKSGSWLSYTRKNGEEIRGQGLANFMSALRPQEGILEEMTTLALPLLKDQTDLLLPDEDLQSEGLQGDILEGVVE